MLVKTETGSTYEFDFSAETARVRRVNPETSAELRKDGDWLALFTKPTIEEGAGMTLLLEPLSAEAAVTMRVTSGVTEIIKENGE